MAMLLLESMTTIDAHQSGWVNNGKAGWSYIKEDGTKATGWLKEGDIWYYLDENGIMKTGWQQIKEKWYYFDSNGVMVTNTTMDGYYIGTDGVWEESGNNLFYNYLREKMIPTVGLANLGQFDSMKDVDFSNINKFFVDSKYTGLISTYIGDVNYDGKKEMITFHIKGRGGKDGTLNNCILYFDLYRIRDGKVSFLKHIGGMNVNWISITDASQNLKIGIKEYKNHIYLFIDDEGYIAGNSWNSLSYYNLTDSNNISYVNYYKRWFEEGYYEKTLNNKTELLCKGELNSSGSLIFSGKYSSEEEVENAIQKELDSVGLGRDREINSQKILECTAKTYGEDGHKMCTNLADYTNIRDTLNIK